MSATQMKKWVRTWWAVKMRSGDMPDLPPEFEHDERFHNIWTFESRRIAEILDPRP